MFTSDKMFNNFVGHHYMRDPLYWYRDPVTLQIRNAVRQIAMESTLRTALDWPIGDTIDFYTRQSFVSYAIMMSKLTESRILQKESTRHFILVERSKEEPQSGPTLILKGKTHQCEIKLEVGITRLIVSPFIRIIPKENIFETLTTLNGSPFIYFSKESYTKENENIKNPNLLFNICLKKIWSSHKKPLNYHKRVPFKNVTDMKINTIEVKENDVENTWIEHDYHNDRLNNDVNIDLDRSWIPYYIFI